MKGLDTRYSTTSTDRSVSPTHEEFSGGINPGDVSGYSVRMVITPFDIKGTIGENSMVMVLS
jgi:hypothetical protein